MGKWAFSVMKIECLGEVYGLGSMVAICSCGMTLNGLFVVLHTSMARRSSSMFFFAVSLFVCFSLYCCIGFGV